MAANSGCFFVTTVRCRDGGITLHRMHGRPIGFGIYFAVVVSYFFFFLLFSSLILSGRTLDLLPHMVWPLCEFRMYV